MENQESTPIEKEGKKGNPLYIIGTVIAILLLIALGYFIYTDLAPKDSATGNQDTATTTLNGDEQTTSNGTQNEDGGTEVYLEANQLVEDTTVPHPSLDREVQYAPEMDAAFKAQTQTRIVNSRAKLKEDPTLFGEWLDLALLYKSAEDYDAAREVWEYLNLSSPNNSISFANLGNLYHVYIPDYVKSEQNYRVAIKNNPQTAYYVGLHELYKYSYKTETSAAADILKEGLTVHPGDITLLMNLGEYYRLNNNPKSAEKYYLEARAEAVKINDTDLMQSIDALIASLPLK